MTENILTMIIAKMVTLKENMQRQIKTIPTKKINK